MADVSEKCKTGHAWDYAAGTCMFCNKNYDEYKAELKKSQMYEWYKCTCGSEKAGYDTHAHYCDKASK